MKKLFQYAIKFEYTFFAGLRIHTVYASNEQEKNGMVAQINSNGWKVLEVKEV